MQATPRKESRGAVEELLWREDFYKKIAHAAIGVAAVEDAVRISVILGVRFKFLTMNL